jgi:hypothetical protein
MTKSKPYNEKNDDPQDKRMTRGMTPAEKKEYKKKDHAHGKKKKPKTMAEDDKADLKIRKEILAKRKKK